METHQTQISDVLSKLENAIASKTNDAQLATAILKKIRKWAGSDPTLTQLLCESIAATLPTIIREKDPDIVDTFVQQKIIQDWENGKAGKHLQQIQAKLLAPDTRDSLLILYLQVLQRGAIRIDQSPEQSLLLDTGLVTLKDDCLSANSAIYTHVFDANWIEQQVPGITRPVAIVKPPSAQLAPRRRATDQDNARNALVLSTRRKPPLLPPLSPIAKTAIAAGGIALLIGIFAYLQRPGRESPSASKTPKSVSQSAIAKQSQSPQTAVQINLLGDTFSGYSTFRNADFQATLQAADISLNYADEFDQSLRAQKLNKGEADLIITTLDQFLQQQPKGKIVGLLDRTVGADAVVLNTPQYPELTSLLQLKERVQQAKAEGQKLSITYAADTPSEYLALVLDTQFDTFNLSDFELKPVADASEAWSLMQDPAANVAIAVLWEPYVTRARQEGYSIALSSQDTPNIIVDVIVASNRLIDAKPEVISQLLEKYYRRIDANVRDGNQLQSQIAEDGNLSVAEAATIIEGINFFTATEASNWLKDGTLAKRIGSTAAILTLSNRLESVPATPQALYTPNFVTEAANNTQALIDLIEADNPELAQKLSGNLSPITPSLSNPTLSNPASTAADIGNLQVRGQVSFNTGSAQLTPEGQQTLTQQAAELDSFSPETTALRIIGHTSRSGNADSNLALSEARAIAVADYLKNEGVQLAIVSEGKGFNQPLNNIEPQDARNQRTEIRLTRLQ